MMRYADNIARLNPSMTLAISNKTKALISEGMDIVDLGIGEPHISPPEYIVNIAAKSPSLHNKYTHTSGSVEVREAIVYKCKRDNYLTYSKDEVMIFPGAKPAIFFAFMATINFGDEVIIPAPCWVSYPDVVTFFGGKPKIVHCGVNDHYKITPAALEAAINEKTKWFVLNSPCNPTGAVYTEDELIGLGEVLRKYPHVMIMTDYIYEAIVYNDKFVTIQELMPELNNRALLINGLSKSHAVTGWRIGYAAGPKDLIKTISDIASHSFTNTSTISQDVCVAALRHDDQSNMLAALEIYRNNLDIMYSKLNEIKGIKPYKPSGAFYIFSDMSDLINTKTPSGAVIQSSNDFANYLLDSGVAIVPGEAFHFPKHFRASFATSENRLIEGVNKIKIAVEALTR